MFLKHEGHGSWSGKIHHIDRLAYFPVLISFQGIACVTADLPVQISPVQGNSVLQFSFVAIRSVSPRPAISFLFGCPFSWLLQWHRFLIPPSVHLSIKHYTGFLQESYSENQQTIGGFPIKTDNKIDHRVVPSSQLSSQSISIPSKIFPWLIAKDCNLLSIFCATKRSICQKG